MTQDKLAGAGAATTGVTTLTAWLPQIELYLRIGAALVGTGPRGCRIENPRGAVKTFSGNWGLDAIAGSFTATNIADDGHVVNTTDKYFGKLVYDSSNQRLMFALGSATTDGWRVADGSATVTPS